RAAPAARAVACALLGLASADYHRDRLGNLCGARSRAFDQPLSGGSATGHRGTLCSGPSSTLSWRDDRGCRSRAAILVSMGAVAAGTCIHVPVSAHQIRGAGAFRNVSGISGLHGADGPFGAGRVLAEIGVA